MKLQQVHLRVNDAATGQPTPVRLRITDADGVYYAPYGRLTEFATGVNQDVGGNIMIGAKKWAYIDGACEILLPPGSLHIEVTKGPEYKPIDENIELLAGKMSLRLQIERWSDVRKQGWYSGDARVHFLSPDAALLEGQAEDVAVVNLLAAHATINGRRAPSDRTLELSEAQRERLQFLTHLPMQRPLTPEEHFEQDAYHLVKVAASILQHHSGREVSALSNILSFSGQSFARQSPDCGVAVNTHNMHMELGSLGLLHCHRVVYPLNFDDQEWTLADWCGQCHRKNGLVVWTNPQHQTADFLYGEPLADLILGHVDAFELTFFEDSPFDVLADYYRMLDANLVVPLVGASGKDSNGLAIGSMRTYACLEHNQEFTYTNWIDAVRAGRSYVSNGPLLQFTINGEAPTTILNVPAATRSLRVRAEANCLVPFEHLEVIWNGKTVADVLPASSSECHAVLEWDLPVNESGWLALRCRGDMHVPSRPAPQLLFAHTSAVAVRIAESPRWAKETQVHRLMNELDAVLHWASQIPRRERVIHILEEARTILAKKLSP